MANFSLQDYETVEERIRRFYDLYPDGRIVTEDYTTEDDRLKGVWRVKTTVFLDEGSQAAGLPKATGHAFEVDGQSGANKTSALENCETSSIGRCLANMNLSGNKRASREEMAKVQRDVAPVRVPDGFVERVDAAETVAELEALWNEAVQGGFHAHVSKPVGLRKKALS
jgi:hypothetical protein